MILKLENLTKDSNKTWKLIADIMLYSLVMVNPVVISAGLSDETTKWILFSVNMLIVLFKTVSKFTSNEE